MKTETKHTQPDLLAQRDELRNMLQRMVDETSDGESKPCLLTLEHARAALAKCEPQQPQAYPGGRWA